MSALVWVAIGMMIGYSAARARGWSPAIGMAAGAMLGILSPLLFAVSSVGPSAKAKADQDLPSYLVYVTCAETGDAATTPIRVHAKNAEDASNTAEAMGWVVRRVERDRS